MENYVVITTSEQKYTVLQTLSKFERKLPHADFMRVHRSFLVNINKINSIIGNKINIKDTDIPIGTTYKKELIKKLDLI